MTMHLARLRSWGLGLLVFTTTAGCQRLDAEPEDEGPRTTEFDFEGSSSGDPFLDSSAEETGDDGPAVTNCDPITAAECAPGQKCTAVLSGSSVVFTCVETTGTAQTGDGCTVSLDDGLDGCAFANVCLGDDDGTCRRLCDGPGDCTDGQCLDDPIHGVPHCARDCDAFEPACPSLLQCRRQSDRFSCVDAVPGDDGSAGDPCLLDGDAGCGEGLMCVTGALVPGCASGGCCVPLCDLDAGDSCSSPSTCNAALEAPAPGWESVGACFVPA